MLNPCHQFVVECIYDVKQRSMSNKNDGSCYTILVEVLDEQYQDYNQHSARSDNYLLWKSQINKLFTTNRFDKYLDGSTLKLEK